MCTAHFSPQAGPAKYSNMRFSFIAILFIIFSAAFALPIGSGSDDSSQVGAEDLLKKLPQDLIDKRIMDTAIRKRYETEYIKERGKHDRAGKGPWDAEVVKEGYKIKRAMFGPARGVKLLIEVQKFSEDLKSFGPHTLIGWWTDDYNGYIVYHTPPWLPSI
ncbi:hypothetical protein F5887DRAFT_979990 [Amanita rubescens]|nr:hypothetical protein F5887DRAFT_979990 [Amanita rubescens]